MCVCVRIPPGTCVFSLTMPRGPRPPLTHIHTPREISVYTFTRGILELKHV